MLLKISHVTRYDYDSPVSYGLQQVRKTPKSTRGQTVRSWSTSVEGGRKEVSYEDHHRNIVELISFETGATGLVIRSQGEVQLTDTAGVLGRHEGFTPLWLFQRFTRLTQPGPLSRALVAKIGAQGDLDRLHELSATVRAAVSYSAGATSSTDTSEEVLAAQRGVCQDHSHVFLTCARLMGFPARYVSGYLMMNDRIAQEATHAWAEAHIDGLGWVGFDVSNAISPDTRYVRVATGLDYSEAAPISGHRFGSAGESLTVSVEVAQQ